MLRRVDTRWQAFGIHLAISFLMFLVILCILLFVWYPGVFIHFGGWQGIRIVAGVDLVLGPLLTLIVYNKLKKTLAWDLTSIAVLQISCLAIGIWIVYSERPLIQIKYQEKVYVLSQSDFDLYKLDTSKLKKYSGKPPYLVQLSIQNDPNEIQKYEGASALLGGEPIYMKVDLYEQISQVETETKTRECQWLNVESKHLFSKTCFNNSFGILKVSLLERSEIQP